MGIWLTPDGKHLLVGLLGIGTVGGGTFGVLARNRDEIERRAGRRLNARNAVLLKRLLQFGARHLDRLRQLFDGELRRILRQRKVKMVEHGHERAGDLREAANARALLVLNRATLKVREVRLRAHLRRDGIVALDRESFDHLREFRNLRLLFRRVGGFGIVRSLIDHVVSGLSARGIIRRRG